MRMDTELLTSLYSHWAGDVMLPVLATVVKMIWAFVNERVPIVPLPVNWNVHVSVCAIPAKAPNVKRQTIEMMIVVFIIHPCTFVGNVRLPGPCERIVLSHSEARI